MGTKNRSLEMKTIKARHQSRYGGTPKKRWSLDTLPAAKAQPEIKIAKRVASDVVIWTASEHKGARILRSHF